MSKTKLSSKGQVVIPREVRDAHRWKAGLEFEIEDRPEGVLLKPVRQSAVSVKDVLGCTGYKGPTKSIDDMNRAVVSEAKHRAKRS